MSAHSDRVTLSDAEMAKILDREAANAREESLFGPDASARAQKTARAEATGREDLNMQTIANESPQGQTNHGLKTNNPATERAEHLLEALLRRYQQEGAYSIEIEITPELAAILLTRNEQNRTPKRKVIEDIAADIAAGRWVVNGETIIISPEGMTNDGQHRLHAVVLARLPIRTFVAVGLGRSTRQTVDSTQTTRTPGDFISMKGIEDGNSVAAVAGYLWQVRRYGVLPVHVHSGAHRPTKRELDQFAVENLSLIQSALAIVPSHGSQKIASRSLLALAFIILREKDEVGARQFIADMISGANLSSTSPLYTVRERMMEDKRRRTFLPRDAVELLLRAWNAHRGGRRLSKFVCNGQWPVVSR